MLRVFFSRVADYARTLREWQRRFEATFDEDIVPALKEAYPELRNSPEGVQVFRRKWICESGVVGGWRLSWWSGRG